MSDTDIIIRIINEVEINESLSNSGSSGASSGGGSGGDSSKINYGKLGYRYGRKLAAAFGNEQINQVSQVVSTGVRYAGTIASHGWVGVAEVALDIGIQALTKVIENEKKIAAINNEAYANSVLAGTLDISNADISKNFFTGAYKFTSK